jgi:hypothetical protein
MSGQCAVDSGQRRPSNLSTVRLSTVHEET